MPNYQSHPPSPLDTGRTATARSHSCRHRSHRQPLDILVERWQLVGVTWSTQTRPHPPAPGLPHQLPGLGRSRSKPGAAGSAAVCGWCRAQSLGWSRCAVLHGLQPQHSTAQHAQPRTWCLEASWPWHGARIMSVPPRWLVRHLSSRQPCCSPRQHIPACACLLQGRGTFLMFCWAHV